MHFTRFLSGAALIGGFFGGPGATAAEPVVSPVGNWRTIDDSTGKPRAIVRLELVDGALQGTIDKSLDAGTNAAALCEKCPGPRKGQPIIGMAILTGLKPVPTDPLAWEGGEILDPDSGTIYRARLRLMPGGASLELRGFVGLALFGRTQIWQRD